MTDFDDLHFDDGQSAPGQKFGRAEDRSSRRSAGQKICRDDFVSTHGRPKVALAELSRVAQGPVAVTIWPRHPTKGQVLLGEAVKAAGVARPDWLPTLAADNFPPMAWHVAVSSGPVPGAPPHTERVLGTGRSE